jgi:hypothetical protein
MFSKIKKAIGQLVQILTPKRQKTTNIFTYPSLSQINLNIWFDVLESGNLENLNTTPEHFEKLYDEYFEAIDNKASKFHINENFKKVKLAHRIDILIKCFETLTYIYNHALKLDDALSLEKKLIETVNILHPKAKITGSIENKLKVLEQLIVINTNEFKRIEVKQNSNKEKHSFISQVVSIELALNFKIDINTTSVAKYIEYYKIAQKQHGKRKE